MMFNPRHIHMLFASRTDPRVLSQRLYSGDEWKRKSHHNRPWDISASELTSFEFFNDSPRVVDVKVPIFFRSNLSSPA